MATDKYQ